MADLPSDWRARTLEMVLGRAPPDGSMVCGGPWSTPVQQVEVYAEQFRLRLLDVLRDDLIGTTHLLGDRTDATLLAYLADHPPDTWTLARAADRLEGWLAAQGAASAVVEMARLDRLVQHGFTAAPGVTPAPEALASALADGASLRLQPHVRLTVVHHDVHLVRADLTAGDAPRALTPTTHHLAVFRGPELRMRHLDMRPGAWAILDAFGADGAPVDAAVDAAVAVQGEAAVAPHLQGWFGLFMARGLLELADRPVRVGAV